MTPAGIVAEAHRPTAGDLLGPRLARLPAAARVPLAAAGALLVVAVAALVALKPGEEVHEYIQRGQVAFNFRYPDPIARVAHRGAELVRLERRRPDGLFVQSFAVEPLELPAYRGESGGILPIVAETEMTALARRFREFELVQEGKTRLNEVPGYTITFRARLGARRLFGREVMLPEPVPGGRRGVRLLLLATPSAGVNRAEEVGVRGVIKRPYRTFRFGTEAP
jgi:hypothetical protein